MYSSIVRGMPYGTMNYQYDASNGAFGAILPTVVSQIQLYSPPVADSKFELVCSKGRGRFDNTTEQLVKKSVKIIFLESDITWVVFYSHPVYVRCYDMTTDTTNTPFVIQATRLANSTNVDLLFTSRVSSKFVLLYHRKTWH